MSKTNHARGFVDYRFNLGQRTSRYFTGSFKQTTIEGDTVVATSTVCSENSTGVRRDRAGAKKFVHSRRRRADRDFLKKMVEA
jgi:hypothetical protein